MDQIDGAMFVNWCRVHTVLLFLASLCILSNVQAQRQVRVLFYNCENLMDTIDDPETNDNEFMPGSIRNWNTYRYYYKLKQLSKVLLSAGEWEELSLIGLAEVENRDVLHDLIHHTPLYLQNYKIVHYSSPDSRGIDVALLYTPAQFTLISSRAIPINLGQERSTRDILHVQGILRQSGDTVNVLVNHWPSRWGGQVNSEWRRMQAAKKLVNYLDSTSLAQQNTIIMGDFNDTPTDASIQLLTNQNRWANLADGLGNSDVGTHYYHDEWAVLDQVLVSPTLANAQKGLHVSAMQIHKPDFLLRTTNATKQPLRTYRGMQYEGGFSDHLPVFVDLIFGKYGREQRISLPIRGAVP